MAGLYRLSYLHRALKRDGSCGIQTSRNLGRDAMGSEALAASHRPVGI